MNDHSTEISTSARFTSLPRLLAWVEDCAAASRLAPGQSQRLQLVVEELFANTIHHGYGGECERPVRLSWQTHNDRITLGYADEAPPFNLLEAAPLPPSQERIGGAGLNLVRALASTIRFRRDGRSNVTELDFSRGE